MNQDCSPDLGLVRAELDWLTEERNRSNGVFSDPIQARYDGLVQLEAEMLREREQVSTLT